MNMKRKWTGRMIAAVISVTLLTGCSPRAIVDMYSAEYAPTSADSVRVFNLGEQVPPHTLAIGEVRIVDGGLALNGGFDKVMRLAIDKTASNGGNGLVVTEHRFPDFWSSIHRVSCTMLRIPQAVADSLARADGDSLAQMQQERWNYAAYREYMARERKNEEQRATQPKDILRFSIGPSLMTSQYQLGNHLYKSRCGIDLSLDYDHWWKGLGFGINYRHDYTPFEEGVVMRTNYIGPSFVMAYLNNGIRYDMAIGFGYYWYSEYYRGYSETEGHVAPLIRMGMEFSISKRAAIGLQMNMLSIHLDEPEGIELKKNEFYGIQRIGLQLGARFYL